jgi:hypothetical protein
LLLLLELLLVLLLVLAIVLARLFLCRRDKDERTERLDISARTIDPPLQSFRHQPHTLLRAPVE